MLAAEKAKEPKRPDAEWVDGVPRTVAKPKPAGNYVKRQPRGDAWTVDNIPWPMPPLRGARKGYWSDNGTKMTKPEMQLWACVARNDGRSWNQIVEGLGSGRSTVRDWASRIGTLYAERRVKEGGGESGKG